ncbi:MAG: MBOAT family protein, partial [Cyclobacteriaceae bacterium]
MLFNSIEFAIFLPLVFGLYWVIGARHVKAQNVLLFVASYIFYGWWDWRFLALIFISSLIDFLLAQKIAATEKQRSRKSLLAVSLIVNLGM